MLERPRLDHVLEAARRKRRSTVMVFRWQLRAERNSPIEMVQIERLSARDRIILTPAIRRTVRAIHEQMVQHGEKCGPHFDEIGEDGTETGLLPPNTSAGPIRRTAIFAASSDPAPWPWRRTAPGRSNRPHIPPPAKPAPTTRTCLISY
jgi:hypothetical protein